MSNEDLLSFYLTVVDELQMTLSGDDDEWCSEFSGIVPMNCIFDVKHCVDWLKTEWSSEVVLGEMSNRIWLVKKEDRLKWKQKKQNVETGSMEEMLIHKEIR